MSPRVTAALQYMRVPISSHPHQRLFDLFFFQIYLAVPGLSCGTQDLELQHSGSSSLTRNGTRTPCIGSMEP